MVIDCESCAVRFSACGECVVGVLLGMPPGAPTVSLDAPERQALDVLAELRPSEVRRSDTTRQPSPSRVAARCPVLQVEPNGQNARRPCVVVRRSAD